MGSEGRTSRIAGPPVTVLIKAAWTRLACGLQGSTARPAGTNGPHAGRAVPGTVLARIGERTTPMAVEILAHALFDSRQAAQVIAVEEVDLNAGELLYLVGEPASERDQRIGQLDGLAALEVTEEVCESAQSVVFELAASRMHAIKAPMTAAIGATQ